MKIPITLTFIFALHFGALLYAQNSDGKADTESDDDKSVLDVQFGEASKTRWRAGAYVVGGGKQQSVYLTVPVPNDWPEQTVSLVEEELPEAVEIQIDYRVIPKYNVRQLLAHIPDLPGKTKAIISTIVDVETKAILEPSEEAKAGYCLPKSSHKEGKFYRKNSPQVSLSSKIKKQARKIIEPHDGVWEKVEAIYKWVRENIEQEDGDLMGASKTLRRKAGNNEDRIFLFVALCRTVKIPARIVYANKFNYAEFMLSDRYGKKTYWFPANINGHFEFGSLANPRIILQKGDHIPVPEKEKPQKYVAEFIQVTGTKPPVFGAIRGEIDATDSP